MKKKKKEKCVSCSVVSGSLHLCPWDSPGKNTGVCCHSLLQGIFPIQGSDSALPHCRHILYHLSHQGLPEVTLMHGQGEDPLL